jgi:hypothetical protein
MITMHGGERSCAGGIDIPHVPVGNSALVAKSLFATGIHGDVYPSSGTLSLYYLVSSPPLRDPTASVSSNILFFLLNPRNTSSNAFSTYMIMNAETYTLEDTLVRIPKTLEEI